MPGELQGIPAAPGLTKGPAMLWDRPLSEIPDFVPPDLKVEKKRLLTARQLAASQLGVLAKATADQIGEDQAALFEAQVMFLEDAALVQRAEDMIQKGVNAERAWHEACEFFAIQIEGLPDETLRARSVDVRDVARRVTDNLLGVQVDFKLEHPAVILSNDLVPSETARFERSKVLAICTSEGGPTSHTAILAKAFGIPAVVGLGEALLKVVDGTTLLVDGTSGTVLPDPTPGLLHDFNRRIQLETRQRKFELELATQPAETSDGHRVEIAANVGNIEDARKALESGAEGIGLLRTEFLFLNRNQAPDEQTQYLAYRAIFQIMENRPVVVRTLDIGGDKEVPYYDFGIEANPFLGYRAIRISLERPDEFKAQLRALLRAGSGHDFRVMFPMIATVDEVRQTRALLDESAGELSAEQQDYAQNYQVGIMVEIPAVALMAERFSREVDFFSIGTNDLTQYSLAAERGNPRVSHLNDACHPAVLMQIDRVVTAAHRSGKWVGVCGEMGGDPEAIPLLLGLGLDELSMSPSLVPHAKQIIRSWALNDARKLARKALKLDSANEVRAAVRNFGR
jgi:phosphoenolpyruvate-protein phosphotransferase